MSAKKEPSVERAGVMEGVVVDWDFFNEQMRKEVEQADKEKEAFIAALKAKKEQEAMREGSSRDGQAMTSQSSFFPVNQEAPPPAPHAMREGSSRDGQAMSSSQPSFSPVNPATPTSVWTPVNPGRNAIYSLGTHTTASSIANVPVGPRATNTAASSSRVRRPSVHPLRAESYTPRGASQAPQAYRAPRRQQQGPKYAPPKWYTDINPNGNEMGAFLKKRDEDIKEAIRELQSLRSCMDQCVAFKDDPVQLAHWIDRLRIQVHKAEFQLVEPLILKKVKILDNATGLPRIFAPAYSEGVAYPDYLRSDAVQLYNRWCERKFAIDLLRGMIPSADGRRNGDKLDPQFASRKAANFYGEEHLVMGQWWPTQLTCVRDGAHGSSQAGIYGEKNHGAYSIVVSGSSHSFQYEDKDEGDTLYYCGTMGKDQGTDRRPTFEASSFTQRLLETADRVHNAVRVLRSWKLPEDNQYRPECGYRYDGLYDVVSYERLSQQHATYRFKLVRRAGQQPIRCRPGPHARPTEFEIQAYHRLKLNHA